MCRFQLQYRLTTGGFRIVNNTIELQNNGQLISVTLINCNYGADVDVNADGILSKTRDFFFLFCFVYLSKLISNFIKICNDYRWSNHGFAITYILLQIILRFSFLS